MLADRDLQLLTACVDGELSPGQRRHVDRLLERSPEARETLRRLEADSRNLIELPRVTAPADLADSVMSAVGKTRPRPTPRPRPVAVRTFPAWTGLAAAVLVLVVGGLGSFLAYFPNSDAGAVTKKGREDTDRPNPDNGGLVKNVPAPKSPDRDDPAVPEEPEAPDREPPMKTPDKPRPIHKPIVERPDEPLFGDGTIEPFSKLERVELPLPEVLKLHDLAKADEAKKLRKELTGSSAVRVELPAKNATRAFERVKAILEARKIALVIDPVAKKKLETPQFTHHYGLFLENVTADDLTELLAAIGKLDREAGEKKASEQRFDGSLVVKVASSHDEQELTALLGVDPIRVRPAPPKPSGIDLRRPLSDQTEAQVEGVLEGKLAPRPNSTQPRQSVLVTSLGTRSRSPEIKRFLEARKPAREGTLQVFLVLRQLPN